MGLARAARNRRAIHRVNSSLLAQFASQLLTGDHPQQLARPGADPSCSQLGENEEHQQAPRSHGQVEREKKKSGQNFLNFGLRATVLLSPAERTPLGGDANHVRRFELECTVCLRKKASSGDKWICSRERFG
jgi:hypothetical protein